MKGIEIERVSDFRYLGRDLEETDDDTLAIDSRLKKARKRWNQVHPVLARKGARARIMARAYVSVVQAVLLFGSETWVIKEREWQKLESFHHSCARRITRRLIRSNPDGTWTYPDNEETLEIAGLFPIREYVARRRHTIMRYVQERPIWEHCQTSAPVATAPNKKVWWKQ